VPGNIANHLGEGFDAIDLMASDARLHTIRPCAFHKGAASVAITGFGDAAATNRLTTRTFTRHQAEIGHQLARASKAREVADFGDEHNRIDHGDATHRLQGIDNRTETPIGKKRQNLPLDALQPPLRIANNVNIVLKHDLLRWVFESQARQPAPIGHPPRGSATVLAAVTEEEPLQMLAGSCQHLPGNAAQLNQIAHRLMISVRHPHGCQLPGPEKAAQHRRVTPVRLHPLARLARDQRWCHHITAMTQACQLTLNAIAARTRFIAKCQLLSPSAQTIAKLPNCGCFIVYFAKIFQATRPTAFRNSNRNPKIL
jgi:hypothetical protein